MSLCYDSEKWLMITFASVAITMIVGLVLMQYGHGQDETKQLINNTKQYNLCLDTFKETYSNLDQDKETKELICGSLWGEDGIREEEIESDNGLIIDDNPTVDRDALISKLNEIKQYCLDHTDRIISGGNPVQNLINAGMIRQDIFQNITCQEVDNEILWTELGKGENLKGALGID
jgi:hypothetical protein